MTVAQHQHDRLTALIDAAADLHEAGFELVHAYRYEMPRWQFALRYRQLAIRIRIIDHRITRLSRKLSLTKES